MNAAFSDAKRQAALQKLLRIRSRSLLDGVDPLASPSHGDCEKYNALREVVAAARELRRSEYAPEYGRRYELYDGEVFVVPSPMPLHQIAAQRFFELLRAYRREHGGLVFISPIDVVFSEFEVVQPDIVFFQKGRTAR
jgi:Uma2 family endonuclease